MTNPGADDGPADVASGHGTFVAGVVLGDGSLSSGPGNIEASLPRRLAWSSRPSSSGWRLLPGSRRWRALRVHVLAGRPTGLTRPLRAGSRAHGARLHVIAWGTPARGAYDSDAYEADLFLWEHPDAVVLVAPAGTAPARMPMATDASTPVRSICLPRRRRTSSPWARRKGRPCWASLATGRSCRARAECSANRADRADPVYGQPDRMALLSSVGPTSDGRVKPDVCAPGTDVVGPRSSLATGRGWGLVSPSPHYMADGGTSAAVGGAAGGSPSLLRQAWRGHRRGRAPSGATLKALAILLGATPVLSRAGTQPDKP